MLCGIKTCKKTFPDNKYPLKQFRNSTKEIKPYELRLFTKIPKKR